MAVHLTDGEQDILAEIAQDAWDAQEARWAEMPADVQFWLLQADEDRDVDDYWEATDEAIASLRHALERRNWEIERELIRQSMPCPPDMEGVPF